MPRRPRPIDLYTLIVNQAAVTTEIET